MDKTIRERRQERHALVGATEFGIVYDNEFLQGAAGLTGRFHHWLMAEELLAGAFDSIRDGHLHPLRGLQEWTHSPEMGPGEFKTWADGTIQVALAAIQTSPKATEPLLAMAEARAHLLLRLVDLAMPILSSAPVGTSES
jgi:hypothetical protein